MTWRFRRSFKVAPGLRLNIGKKSASVRVGGRGFGFTAGTAGKTISAGVPGTGLGYSRKLRRRKNPPYETREIGTAGPGLLMSVVKLVGALLMLGLFVLLFRAVF